MRLWLGVVVIGGTVFALMALAAHCGQFQGFA